MAKKRGNERKYESNLDLIIGGIGNRILRKRSIGVTVTGSEGEEPINKDNEHGGNERDFDLPKRRNQETEDGEIHGGYNENGHDNRSEGKGVEKFNDVRV